MILQKHILLLWCH